MSPVNPPSPKAHFPAHLRISSIHTADVAEAPMYTSASAVQLSLSHTHTRARGSRADPSPWEIRRSGRRSPERLRRVSVGRAISVESAAATAITCRSPAAGIDYRRIRRPPPLPVRRCSPYYLSADIQVMGASLSLVRRAVFSDESREVHRV